MAGRNYYQDVQSTTRTMRAPNYLQSSNHSQQIPLGTLQPPSLWSSHVELVASEDLISLLGAISEDKWAILQPAFCRLSAILNGLSRATSLATSDIFDLWDSPQGQLLASIDLSQSYELYFRAHFQDEMTFTFGPAFGELL